MSQSIAISAASTRFGVGIKRGVRWVVRASVCTMNSFAQFLLVWITCSHDARKRIFLVRRGGRDRGGGQRVRGRAQRGRAGGGGRDAARRLVSPRLAIAKWRRRQHPTPPAQHKDGRGRLKSVQHLICQLNKVCMCVYTYLRA